jgi:hypothetical protein
MKKLILAVLFISVFASCKKELEPQSTTIAAPPVSQNPSVPVTPVAAPAPQVVQNIPNPNVQVAPQQVAMPPQKVAKGMNPPHGQPNHRCDIAVGQPLSLPISKTKSVTVPPPANGSASITPVKMENAPAPTQSAEVQTTTPVEKSATPESK